MFDERMSGDMIDNSFFMIIDILKEFITYLSWADHEEIKIKDSLLECFSRD